MANGGMIDEVVKLRKKQAERVMPLIGPLLDAWDNTDNDTKSTLRAEYPVLCDYLDKIESGMNLDWAAVMRRVGEI